MKSEGPVGGGTALGASVPWFIRAARSIGDGKDNELTAWQLPRDRQRPPELMLRVPEPQGPAADEDGILPMQWPGGLHPGPGTETRTAADPVRAAVSWRTAAASFAIPRWASGAALLLTGAVIASIAWLALIGLPHAAAPERMIASRQPLSRLKSAPVAVAPPTSVEPARLEPVRVAAPPAHHASLAKPKPVVVKVKSVAKSKPQLLETAAAQVSRGVARRATARTGPVDILPPIAAAPRPRVEIGAPFALRTDDFSLASLKAADLPVELPAEPKPATSRHGRATLPQCKGFQLSRPNTVCRIDAPR